MCERERERKRNGGGMHIESLEGIYCNVHQPTSLLGEKKISGPLCNLWFLKSEIVCISVSLCLNFIFCLCQLYFYVYRFFPSGKFLEDRDLPLSLHVIWWPEQSTGSVNAEGGIIQCIIWCVSVYSNCPGFAIKT